MDANDELKHLREFSAQETKRVEELRATVETQIATIQELRTENTLLNARIKQMAPVATGENEPADVGRGE